MIRAIVQSVAEGVIKRFTASGRTDEVFENREYLQHYGYTSRPLQGAEGIIIKDSNHIIMIATDDRRYRIAIEAGEVCIYTDEGDYIRFKRGKEIYIKSGNKLKADIENDIEVNTKRINATATEEVNVNTGIINATATGSITLQSPVITLKANSINMVAYSGQTSLASLKGNVKIEGKMETIGNINVIGNINASGTIIDVGGNTNHHRH